MLDNTKKNLDDKQKERDNLNRPEQEKSNSPADNSNKLNWAIGLGIGALVVGLLCLILLVSKRKD